MLYLGLRTDSPQAELYLYKDTTKIADYIWQADRELAQQLLGKLEWFLSQHDASFSDVAGLFVYQGPGSFTGLRIGVTVMNTIAYAQDIPVVGKTGDDWSGLAIASLTAGDTGEVVLPLYGAEARITKPKK